MENQLSEAEKARRSDVLEEIEKRDSERFRRYYIGKMVDVLFEEEKEINGAKYWVGHTKEYVKAAVLSDGSVDFSNRLMTGMIVSQLDRETMLLSI